ncbi:MAG: nitroreductase family protein [Bacteroidales bacterium]|nr:nitroreductase family protein [Bacteroidales bacterium]
MKRIILKASRLALQCAVLGLMAWSMTACCGGDACRADGAKSADVVLHNMAQRKSVRHFVEGKEVSKADLETLVKAGMAAPTARNSQPWEFYVVSSSEAKQELEAGLPYAKMLTQASAAIVVCGNTEYMLDGEGREYWVQDCSAATQNILLAAEAMGLGAVWTGVYPVRERVEVVRQALSLPTTHVPLCVIPVGYPTGDDQPKDKFKADRIHWK